MLCPEKAGGCRKYTGKHRAARTGMNFLLLWPAFIHIRRGGILIGAHTKQGKHMLKSTLIAKCLTRCGMLPDIATGEAAVRDIFEEYFPRHSFEKWNTHLDDDVIQHYLEASRGAGTIKVNFFIEDLWDY